MKIFNILLGLAVAILILVNVSMPMVEAPKETKVYLISTIKYDENFIERVYLNAAKAQEYVDTYQDHHDYTIQEITVHE